MKKSFKKYILLPALALSAVAVAATAIACGQQASSSSKVLDDLKANKDLLTTLSFTGDLEVVTGTNDKAALETWFKDNKSNTTPTLSTTTKATRTAELTKADVTVAAPTDTTVKVDVVAVAFDGTDSSKLNVLLKATKGDSSVHFVKQITGKEKNGTTGVSLGLSVGDPTNPRWNAARDILNTAARNYGFSGSTTNLAEQAEQNSALETALNNGAKGILVSTVDAVSSKPLVDAAKAKNVPLVAYDRLITGSSDYDYYVTYDNERVGVMQGFSLIKGIYNATVNFDSGISNEDNIKALVAYVKEHKFTSAKYIYLSAGAQEDNNSALFFNGAMSVINAVKAEDTNLQFLNTNTGFADVATPKWDGKNAASKFTPIWNNAGTEKQSNLVGILAPNDGVANALATELANVGGGNTKWQSVYITGQDGNSESLEALRAKNSKIDMTIKKADQPLSRAGVAILTLLAAYPNATKDQIHAWLKISNPNDNFVVNTTSYTSGSKAITTILLSPTIVTQDNVATEFPK
ncbi:substrate-binding domain-containing protein [Mycoplasmopsis agassizii]|uniref:substrate-binding domain-containing protein n=1 Tax=Mycoplasmopsis agassizii TaxID=33922 RepID=UPI003527FF88